MSEVDRPSGWMRASRGLWLALALAPGCIYLDPINQRPSIRIDSQPSTAVHRGDQLTLAASSDDPDGDQVFFQWRMYACADASDPQGCDTVPADTGLATPWTFTVPPKRADGTPVQSLLVKLEGTDARGATAKPIQQLVIPVDDHPPELMLRADSPYEIMPGQFVVGTPIDLYAAFTDPDDLLPDGQPNVQLDWQVFSPASQPPYTLADLTVPPDPRPSYAQVGKELVPPTDPQAAQAWLGTWEIQVTATDPLGTPTGEHVSFDVVPDHAPCLEQWQPSAAPAGQALPISDPTLFQIDVVQDDLDPYPPVGGNSTTFSWSLLPPGASTRQVLAGVTGNRVALDPATYNPGDVVELRVEIQDRNHTPITCADGSDTCSVISDPTCIQRLTWRVEMQ